MPYILTIRERNNSWAGRSPFASLHATEAEANAALLDYVRRNWESEVGADAPDDPDEIVNEYFSEVLEAYDISETAPQAVGPER